LFLSEIFFSDNSINFLPVLNLQEIVSEECHQIKKKRESMTSRELVKKTLEFDSPE